MTVISPDAFIYHNGVYNWTPERAREAWGQAYSALRTALATANVDEVVLLCGLPGAGKTTWLEDHQEDGVVYFDATFTNRRARKGVIEIITEFDIPYRILVLNTDVDTCMERNDTRSKDRRIPDSAMERMYNSLLWDLPTTWEGFSQVQVEGESFGWRGTWCWIRAAFLMTFGRIFGHPYFQFLPTWLWEGHFAAITLFCVFVTTSDIVGDPHQALINAVAGLAVFFTFQYLTVSTRLQEAQGQQGDDVTVKCYKMLTYYLLAKESAWLLVFLLTGAYTAIVGNVLFLTYPLWRKFYRSCRQFTD